ncbi:hypothetical protein MJH54_28690, partial [Salmonella enterica subsp. enterica serovar Montevideo]|nr:hypothetical protein [Salmonella enterica subsp. enterica serovar Montevideo]
AHQEGAQQAQREGADGQQQRPRLKAGALFGDRQRVQQGGARQTPIIASLLCLLPMYAIRKAPSLAKYRGRLDNVFVTLIGLLTIL